MGRVKHLGAGRGSSDGNQPAPAIVSVVYPNVGKRVPEPEHPPMSSPTSPSLRHRYLLLVALLAAAAVILASCGSDDEAVDAGSDPGAPDAPIDDADLAGGPSRPWIAGDWVLASASGDGTALTIPDGLELALSITGPDQVRGDAGCNTFGGTISAPFDDDRDGGPLSFGGLAQTEMACEHLDFEVAYVGLVTRVDEWELAPPSGLVFRGPDVELVYEVAEPTAATPLEETVWTFDTVFAGEGVERTASSTRSDKPAVTATITDGLLTLSSEDCGPHQVAVAYEPGGEGNFTPEDPATVVPDCDDPESNLLLAADGVAQATGYQVVGDRLTLIGLPGETVSFRAGQG